MTKRSVLWSLAVVVLVGASCRIALAEEDHLVGYQVKDLDKIKPGGMYTVTNQFGTTTCELKVAKFFLVRGEKNAGDDPAGGPAGKFICYKAKCDGSLPPTKPSTDQFGSHNLETKKVKIICAPAQADCESMVGGFCWFLGKIGESCDKVCTDNDRTYDTATDTYAGSSGMLANCTAVMNDIGVAGVGVDNGACADAVGCFTTAGTIVRCTAPPTTAAASNAVDVRVCACQ